MKINRWSAALVLGTAIAAIPAAAHAGVFLSINIAPPPIPVYEQPIAPAPDLLWTPGYWQWDASVGDYFWVPGAWVAAPQPGLLWTPGYWGYGSNGYAWNAGYWGPHIGFYGGVNYGFGFFGHGYEGGYWNNNHFFYNTAYSHVNVNVVHNTYIHNTTIINNVHTSYVGGQGGLQTRPGAGEQAAFREQHFGATQAQTQHVNFARQDRGQFAQQNHGVPQAAALARPVNSAQGFQQAAQPARAAGGNFTPQRGNAQQRGFMNDGGAPQGNAGNFNNGAQGRGFGAAQPSGNAAVTDRGTSGAPSMQQPAGQTQRQFGMEQQRTAQQPNQQFQQRTQQQPAQNQQFQQRTQQQQVQNQQFQQRAQPQQVQQSQPRPQVQQQRPQAQPQRQAEPRAEGHGNHEERPH